MSENEDRPEAITATRRWRPCCGTDPARSTLVITPFVSGYGGGPPHSPAFTAATDTSRDGTNSGGAIDKKYGMNC